MAIAISTKLKCWIAVSLCLCYIQIVAFLIKFIARIAINAVVLYAAKTYFPGFILNGGLEALLVGALVLTILNIFVAPVLRLIATPLLWLTFGVFGIVINILLLWLADRFLTQLVITDISTLFWVSIIVALANAFF